MARWTVFPSRAPLATIPLTSGASPPMLSGRGYPQKLPVISSRGGMRRSDLRAAWWLLSLFAALPVIVALALGIVGGDLGLALVVILPLVPFTTLASSVVFFLLWLAFRSWTLRPPCRQARPRVLAMSSAGALFVGQLALHLTDVASPLESTLGAPEWSRVAWLFLLSVWLLTAASGLLVALRQALSSHGRGMWLAYPMLLLSMIHPALLMTMGAMLWVAGRQDHQANREPEMGRTLDGDR